MQGTQIILALFLGENWKNNTEKVIFIFKEQVVSIWVVGGGRYSGYWESESLSLPDHLSVETLPFTTRHQTSNIFQSIFDKPLNAKNNPKHVVMSYAY